ncbi:MAG: response regulator [Deinococcota bacterium]
MSGLSPSSSSEATALRILLAEDDLMSRKLITKVLERLGYTVTAVDNGQDALVAVEGAVSNTAFDVVMMDVNMPQMDGLTATKHIRRMLPKHAQPYIIALTAAAFDDEKQACLDAGMDSFLGKPVRPDMLRDALTAYEQAHATTNSTATSSPPLLDMHALEELRAYSIEQDMVPMLIGIFFEEAPLKIEHLRQAFAVKDVEQVRQLAHSLKSSAATLGASRLSQLFADLEQDARDNDLSNTDSLPASFEEVLEQSIAALNKVLM